MHLLVFFELGAQQSHLHLEVIMGDSVCDLSLHAHILTLQYCVGLEQLLLTLERFLLKHLHLSLHALQVLFVELCNRRRFEKSFVIEQAQLKGFLQQVVFDLFLELRFESARFAFSVFCN